MGNHAHARHGTDSPWCGLCFENIKGRGNHRGHAHYVARRSGGVQLALQKPERVGANSLPAKSVSSASSYLTLFSALTEFLSCVSWTDGSRREPGSLTLSVTAGRWSGKLKDPNRKGYAYLTSETLDGLLEALEGALAADAVDWREDRPFARNGK